MNEDFVMACLDDEEAAEGLLSIATSFLLEWGCDIVRTGLGITLFESWAAPPLLTPGLFRRFAMPYERAIVQAICNAGGNAPSLVIGGDTTAVLNDIVSTGTRMVIADYNADFSAFLQTARLHKLLLRGNIDPKLAASGQVAALLDQARRRQKLAQGYEGFVLGMGVLPYDTKPEHVLALREFCREKLM